MLRILEMMISMSFFQYIFIWPETPLERIDDVAFYVLYKYATVCSNPTISTQIGWYRMSVLYLQLVPASHQTICYCRLNIEILFLYIVILVLLSVYQQYCMTVCAERATVPLSEVSSMFLFKFFFFPYPTHNCKNAECCVLYRL